MRVPGARVREVSRCVSLVSRTRRGTFGGYDGISARTCARVHTLAHSRRVRATGERSEHVCVERTRTRDASSGFLGRAH